MIILIRVEVPDGIEIPCYSADLSDMFYGISDGQFDGNVLSIKEEKEVCNGATG